MEGLWDVSSKAGRESQCLDEAEEERWREQKPETLMSAPDETDKDIRLGAIPIANGGGGGNGILPALSPSHKLVSKGRRQVRKELPLCERRHHSRAV